MTVITKNKGFGIGTSERLTHKAIDRPVEQLGIRRGREMGFAWKNSKVGIGSGLINQEGVLLADDVPIACHHQHRRLNGR